jgi:2,5-diamino-6-(ribosylamino)-4(3H)-pyrimidinone 5'-phosphate reductase
MLPYVVIHNAISADGGLDWLVPEWPSFDEFLGTYYGKAAVFQEDASLCGTETILKAFEWDEDVSTDEPSEPLAPMAGDTRPLLVIPDSRGRVRIWRWLLSQPHWRAGVALCSASTPQDYLDYLDSHGIDHIDAGDGRVDLRAALEELSRRFGVQRIRVDSGGVLNGALLRAGLVDEISLMIVPVLAGGESHVSFFRAPELEGTEGLINMKLSHIERLDNDVVWLRYDVLNKG